MPRICALVLLAFALLPRSADAGNARRAPDGSGGPYGPARGSSSERIASAKSSGDRRPPPSPSADETAEIERTLRGLAEALFVDQNPEAAYRRYFWDGELTEAEKRAADGGIGAHELGDRGIAPDVRARAFAAVWNYEYAPAVLAVGTASDLDGFSSAFDEAHKIVERALDETRARRGMSKDAFYDALDFSYDDPPEAARKLDLIAGTYAELRVELAKRQNRPILDKNVEAIVRDRRVEKLVVDGETIFVVRFEPMFWAVLSDKGDGLRVLAIGDDV